MKLIVNYSLNSHVSNDTVREFENTILSEVNNTTASLRNSVVTSQLFYISYTAIKLGYCPSYKKDTIKKQNG